jgi:uncharacterized protein
MIKKYLIILLLAVTNLSCQEAEKKEFKEIRVSIENNTTLSPQEKFFSLLNLAALERTTFDITYDPSYYKIKYPGGDVPAHLGVCTDVVIRSYRKVGYDLQVLVRDDKLKHPSTYPKKWRRKPDTNIDHRRVLNLMAFFKNQGAELPITNNPKDYQPGDIVCWNLGGAVTHIGIVVNVKSGDGKGYQVVHNIGGGDNMEDVLFDWKIIGHYRYYPGE